MIITEIKFVIVRTKKNVEFMREYSLNNDDKFMEKVKEAYVRYQTLYRRVCNKELFDEFLNKNNLQVIDNMDIQETQI